jgi:exopolysaccharide biosynthesis polyprenyl glycosylphosphotransferase
MAVDATSSYVLFGILVEIRFRGSDPDLLWLQGLGETQVLALGYGALWVFSMWAAGLYRLRTNLSLRTEVRDVLRATGILIALSLVGLAALSLPPSRLLLLSLFLIQPVVSVTTRAALRGILTWIRSRGYNARQILIIGAGPAAQKFADEIELNRALGLRVMGHLRGPRDEKVAVKRPVLGAIDDLETVLHARVVDEVAICLRPEDWILVEPATRLCEEEGRIVRVVVPPMGGVLSGGRYEELGGIPVMTFLYGPDRVIGLALKRAFDIAASIVLLVLLSPVLFTAAVLVRATDGRPVLFRHERIGLQGRPFTCLKFRTMVRGAEAHEDEMERLNSMRGPAFKVDGDPRITRLGRILRRYSIDELPQLLNVLKGDMSIVGPRPAPIREVRKYDLWHRRRLSMRPGLTGLWQVQARGDNDFDRRAELDLSYIDRWSLWLDLMIILRTVPALVHQPGR